SVPEALAALVEYDPDAPADRNEQSMASALSRVRTGEVTRAVRDAVTEAGDVATGDWIALTTNGVVASMQSPSAAVCRLLEHLVNDDSEIVTVLVGCDAPASETQRIRDHIELAFPELEVEFHDGGQPLYPYLVGVE